MEPKRFLVKVNVVNDELVIPLPKEILQDLGLQDGDELDVRIEGRQIILTPHRSEPVGPH